MAVLRSLLLKMGMILAWSALFQWGNAQGDTVFLTARQMLILKDSVFLPRQDTAILLPADTRYKIRKNPYWKSEVFYDSLETKMSRRWLTRELHRLLFRNPTTQNPLGGEPVKSESFFAEFAGRPIASISIRQVPILEGSVWDTSKTVFSGLGGFLNSWHISTSEKLLRNRLRFQVGDPLDGYILSDNERLLRNLDFIEDARIVAFEAGGSDSVHVVVITKDRFPWTPEGGFGSFSDFSVGLGNQNVAGLGFQLSGKYVYKNPGNPASGFDIRLRAQNVRGTLIDGEIQAIRTWDRLRYGLVVERNFLTPDIRFGGGVEISYDGDSTFVVNPDTAFRNYFEVFVQDYWIGRSFSLGPETQRTNLITGLRVANYIYQERPRVSRDSNELFQNRFILLGNASLTRYRFLKSNYILSFGIAEDVPVGYRLTFNAGGDFNEFGNRFYAGLQCAYARYFDRFGYLILIPQVGGFFDGRRFANGVVRAKVGYYSPLWNLGRIRIRNFVLLDGVKGILQPVSENVRLDEFMRDIRGDDIGGEDVFSARLESIWFLPWYLYGFQLAPYGFAEFGLVNEPRFETDYRRSFPSFGLGFRLRNESLVFQTLDMRFTYFTNQPVNGQSFAFFISLSAPRLFELFLRFKPEVIRY